MNTAVAFLPLLLKVWTRPAEGKGRAFHNEKTPLEDVDTF
jgi:hypothetical protein